MWLSFPFSCLLPGMKVVSLSLCILGIRYNSFFTGRSQGLEWPKDLLQVSNLLNDKILYSLTWMSCTSYLSTLYFKGIAILTSNSR